jgi:preprotein translocase subunit SecE
MAKAIVATTPTETPAWKSQPERLNSFLKDVRSEMRKVITPSREEVRSTTSIVIVTVFIFAAYFWIVDTTMDGIIKFVLDHLGKH